MHGRCVHLPMPIRIFSILILIVLVSVETQGESLLTGNRAVRALGMGNAHIAVANNYEALFYNPASLARVSGLNLLIGDISFGANGVEVLETVTQLQAATGFDSMLNSLYGSHTYVGASAKAAFTMPLLGFSVYDTLNGTIDVVNPISPAIEAQVINDLGYSLGVALPILPVFHVGTVFKYINRTGVSKSYGLSYLGELNPDPILAEIQNTKGRGYGMDIGANILIPGPVSPVFSFVWRNVGVTSFRSENATIAAPPRELDEMAIGAALNIDAFLISVNPAIDLRYLNRSDVQLGKKIGFGVELGIPLIDLRAGFNQGYYTAGVGFSLGFIRFDAATYGEEIGYYPGQREDRRYVVSLTMEIGLPGPDLLGFGSSSKSKSSGASGGSKSGGSFGGRKRPKARR